MGSREDVEAVSVESAGVVFDATPFFLECFWRNNFAKKILSSSIDKALWTTYKESSLAYFSAIKSGL
jgi:hypothetical protein